MLTAEVTIPDLARVEHSALPGSSMLSAAVPRAVTPIQFNGEGLEAIRGENGITIHDESVESSAKSRGKRKAK